MENIPADQQPQSAQGGLGDQRLLTLTRFEVATLPESGIALTIAVQPAIGRGQHERVEHMPGLPHTRFHAPPGGQPRAGGAGEQRAAQVHP